MIAGQGKAAKAGFLNARLCHFLSWMRSHVPADRGSELELIDRRIVR